MKIGSSCSGVALSTYVPPVALRDVPERLGVVLGRLQADRDDADVGVVERRLGLLAGRLHAAPMAVGEKHCGRSVVAGLFGEPCRLDERVVDARALGRGRRLRDCGGELVAVPREVREDVISGL